MHPDAIIDDVMVEEEGEVPTLHDGHDTSASEGDIISGVESDGSEEDEEDVEEEDNFNSAGEEVRMEFMSINQSHLITGFSHCYLG